MIDAQYSDGSKINEAKVEIQEILDGREKHV